MLTLDVTLRGDWDDVERVRSSVWNCVTAALGPFDVRDAFAMVVAELLENAVKHGSSNDCGPPRLRLSIDPLRGVVTVRNVVVSDRCAERVLRSLEWLRGFPTSEEAYMARLLALAECPDEGGSGLGLARVAYEGGCTLSADYDGGVLSVTAVMDLGPSPATARG
ncbi:MAG: hypothetical protein IT379_30575 [Deltaproteobacteria bacterium]|nr:hypothetical protein [Deltaproteobacteria bacterium]